MPGPFDYTVDVPSVLPALQMMFEGIESRRERKKEDANLLRSQQMGNMLSQGDFGGAANLAFGAGDVSTGLKVHELSIAEKQRFAEVVGQYATAANTPERWEALRGRLTELTGEDPGDFETGRQELLAEALTVPQLLSVQRQEAGADGGAQSEYGLNPIYGEDESGNPVVMQLGKSGVAAQTQLPEGVQVRRDPIRMDAGTEWVLLDPITRQPITRIPKDIAGEAAAREVGEAQGTARATLGSTIANAEQTLSIIEDIKKDPARQWATGGTSIIASRIPGTAGYDFTQKINQLKGKTFLEAFQALKGGGAITQIEGEKAEQAIARLDTAQTEEGFLQALTDLETVVKAGIERAKQRAGQTELIAGPREGPLPTNAPLNLNQPPANIDPEDWRFMTPEERALFR